MSHILILYASRAGQTARIAKRIADRLESHGHQVTTEDVHELDEDPDVGAFDAVLVGGSVNLGRHDRPLVAMVRRNRHALTARPTGLFSVSLAAAHPEMNETTSRYVQRFTQRTGWQPALTARFAGAIRYSEYGLVKRQVMKRTYGAQGLSRDTARDHEYTDWKRVERFADSFSMLLDSEPAPRKRRSIRRGAGIGAAILAGIGVGAGAYAYERKARPALRNRGATPQEQNESLPGDQLIRRPVSRSTIAIDIDAPRTDVWPWLAQMGSRRAGWYSYHLMDNLRRRSATTIIPGFQDLHEGDLVPAHHSGRVALPVAHLEPERHLVFGHPIDVSTQQSVRRPGLLTGALVWGFHLKELPNDRTRLVVRTTVGPGRNAVVTAVTTRIMEGVHHVRQRRQLASLKARAERFAAQGGTATPMPRSTPTP